jgi:hypothetical protein
MANWLRPAFPILAVMVVAAGVVLALTTMGSRAGVVEESAPVEGESGMDLSPVGAIPPLDARVPQKIETATFALG